LNGSSDSEGNPSQTTSRPDRPRRILFLSPQPFFEWRGSPIRVAADVRALAAMGHEIDLLVLPVGGAIDLPPAVRLHRAPNLFRIRSMAIGPSLTKAVYDLLLLVHAVILAIRRRPDVIHGVEEAGAIAVVLARCFRARAVYEKHSEAGSYRGGSILRAVMRAYRAVEAFSARAASMVIVTGPGMVDDVARNAPTARVHVVHDLPSSPVEATADGAAAVRRDWGAAENDVVALYVGSFAAYQGIDLLCRGLPGALRAVPNLRVVIVGGSAEEAASRAAPLATAGVGDRVMFLRPMPPDRIPDLLRAADILLSPRMAGQNTPLKVLDYLKAGRAILAADSEANRTLLSGETAVLAAPDPDAFGEALAALANDAGRREALGRAGRTLYETHHGPDVFARRLGECYRTLA